MTDLDDFLPVQPVLDHLLERLFGQAGLLFHLRTVGVCALGLGRRRLDQRVDVEILANAVERDVAFLQTPIFEPDIGPHVDPIIEVNGKTKSNPQTAEETASG